MGIKYVFCITTGRSGSNYLSKLFSEVDSCVSRHEEEPVMNGEVMFRYLKGDKKPLRDMMPRKIEAINYSRKDRIYIDTTHCFIKGFGWELPTYIPQEEIAVIVLKRSKEKVVSSLSRIHCNPFNAIGREWIITPSANSIITPPIGKFKFRLYSVIMDIIWKMTERKWMEYKYPVYIQRYSTRLLNWYYDETYAAGKIYAEQFNKIKYVTLDVDTLNSLSEFRKLLTELSISPSDIRDSIHAVIGKPSNRKENWPLES